MVTKYNAHFKTSNQQRLGLPGGMPLSFCVWGHCSSYVLAGFFPLIKALALAAFYWVRFLWLLIVLY